MRFSAAQKKIFRSFVVFSLIFLFLTVCFSVFAPSFVSAQGTPQVGTTLDTSGWQIDTEVTEVGKSAERARQFLWWVFSHPAVHTAPVMAILWSYSRNIVYVFVIFVIILLGLGLIISSRRNQLGPIFSGISSPISNLNVPSILVRVGAVLLYVTFSYLFILALVQISDIVMQFFIHNVGGKDLFNIIFSGGGNIEENYKSFIGFRDTELVNQEMVNTSLFVVRITSLTYYAMGILVVLRTIILWFLMIMSPFLALLMPFIFIRNIGWIWIGVFFQWLFYGPLMALFLAAVTRIWISGIPYAFDFSRINTPEGQVYRTSINILYGGPAQTLSPGNTANYVDTFTEYIISLIMLWAAIILPWFLLRIFRDYCCDIIASGNAILTSILDRLRQLPTPPPPTSPTGPTTTTGMAVELPFRRKVEEKVREIQKVRIEEIKDISKVRTQEIAKAANISVSSLKDVSRLEINKKDQASTRSQINKLARPERIATPEERKQYTTVRNELQKRAISGDKMAQTMLAAGEKSKEVLASQIPASMVGQRPAVARAKTKVTPAPSLPTIIPASKVFVQSLGQPAVISDISKNVGISEEKVREVVSKVPTSGGPASSVISKISEEAKVSKEEVEKILKLASAPSVKVQKEVSVPSAGLPVKMGGKTIQAQVSVEDYEEVKKMWLNHYREAPVPVSETIKDREAWLKEEDTKLQNIVDSLSSIDAKAQQKGLEQVAEILPFMLLGGFSNAEILTYVKAKLEAEKQIQTEFEMREKVKKEIEEEQKAQEVTIEVEGKKEEEKHMEVEAHRKMEIPKKEDTSNKEPQK